MWEGERLKTERRVMLAPLPEKMTNKRIIWMIQKFREKKLVKSKCHPIKQKETISFWQFLDGHRKKCIFTLHNEISWTKSVNISLRSGISNKIMQNWRSFKSLTTFLIFIAKALIKIRFSRESGFDAILSFLRRSKSKVSCCKDINKRLSTQCKNYLSNVFLDLAKILRDFRLQASACSRSWIWSCWILPQPTNIEAKGSERTNRLVRKVTGTFWIGQIWSGSGSSWSQKCWSNVYKSGTRSTSSIFRKCHFR